jgi:hypothetical protein
VHANGLLARRQLDLGHIEAASQTWHTFLDDYVSISSARGDEHFRVLRGGLRAHRGNRAVRQLQQRADEVARQKAA